MNGATADQLTTIAELDRQLTDQHAPYWLFGGWAVDFHAGRVTREHADIDIAIWADDRQRVHALLIDAAWVHDPEVGEDGYTCYRRAGIRLEVAFLARESKGASTRHSPLVVASGLSRVLAMQWPVSAE